MKGDARNRVWVCDSTVCDTMSPSRIVFGAVADDIGRYTLSNLR